MEKVYAMIADGTEEVECLTVVDLLRRSGVETVLVSVEANREIVSSHRVRIVADRTVDEVDLTEGDMLFLPGGMPGAERLSACAPLIEALRQAQAQGRRIAAICAAPGVVLGRHGLLAGKTATCFPGFEQEFRGGVYVDRDVVTDGLLTTARGLGAALELGVELVAQLRGTEAAAELKARIQDR